MFVKKFLKQRSYLGWLINDKYSGKAPQKALEKDIERIKNNEPIDYVIGHRPFLNTKIDLSYCPFIPRTETEFWVEKAIGQIQRQSLLIASRKKLAILDLFSGSGAIGIAILKNISNAMVDFGEIDENFIKQIKLNLKINKAKKPRYRIIKTNIFSNIKKTYDYIFANPPYIANGRKIKLVSSVLKFEPHLALFAGKDGLTIIKQFLNGAKEHLKQDGVIYLEFDHPQKKEIEKILRRFGYSFVLSKDQFGLWRWGRAWIASFANLHESTTQLLNEERTFFEQNPD